MSIQTAGAARPTKGFAAAANEIPRATSRPQLGEFEHQVMVAVRGCGEEAYGLRIAERMVELYGDGLAMAQVYVTLKRLEKKGFLSSQMTVPQPIRGGRSRRVFHMEGKGAVALEQSTAFRSALVASTTGATRNETTEDAYAFSNRGNGLAATVA